LTRRLFYILFLWFGLALTAQAEVVVLRSGQIIKGEILLNNEEVVIIRQKDGLRYQYPQTEVVSIAIDPPTSAATDTAAAERPKVIDIGLSAYGGIAMVPHKGTGSTAEVHAMMGSHNLLNKQIFLGGSLGYRGIFVGEQTYSWIPLQVVLQFPIANRPSPITHRPLIGGSLGYAFATNNAWGSGVCADIHVGWWSQMSERSSLSLALKAQWQQTAITVIETIQETQYTNRIGCSILSLGISLGIHF
jgi:hypothetical protein